MYIPSLKNLFILVIFVSSIGYMFGQEERLNVFIDCNCDKNFLREELSYINHVRDQALADVKIFVNGISNGGGGSTFELRVIAGEQFNMPESHLTFQSLPNMTRDEVRLGLAKKMAIGLLPFLMETGMEDRIEISIIEDETGDKKSNYTSENDPWNNWIFQVYGEGELDNETSRRRMNAQLGFESDHITEDWRIRGDVRLNYSNNRFEDDEEVFRSERKRHFVMGSVVKSLSKHLSAGIFSGFNHDTFRNIDRSFHIRPAIEYNLFPYSEVVYREITFAYKIGYLYNNYIEPTIYERTSENLFTHSLDVQVRFRQTWGDVYTRLEASSFLNDFSKNRFEMNSWASVRVFKGLAVRFSANLQFIRDQINLPAGDASLEDLLLRQRQIATDFELGMGVGLSYTFGSAFNNIVNTRL